MIRLHQKNEKNKNIYINIYVPKLHIFYHIDFKAKKRDIFWVVQLNNSHNITLKHNEKTYIPKTCLNIINI